MPWLIVIKCSKQITLCCTDTVILLIIGIIIKWDYEPEKITISRLGKV